MPRKTEWRPWALGLALARLISESQTIAHELEAALAAFKQTEVASVFPQGYAAALGVVPALVGQGDVVIIDKLVHASLVDAPVCPAQNSCSNTMIWLN